jgi:hypothetical protein
MDQHHVAVLTRTVSRVPSRRDVLRGLVGVGLGLSALRRQDAAEAKKKRKKKKKKPQLPLNAFGCLDVGQPCRGNSANCCSGICQGGKPKKGKKDTSTCVAHNAGICYPDSDSCSLGVAIKCHPSTFCLCVLTTGNAAFCGDFTGGGDKLCRVCSKDTDCQAEFGPGAACVVFAGFCTPDCAATGRTVCVPPCA